MFSCAEVIGHDVMSRSNTNYYNICPWHRKVGEDGYCDIHRPYRDEGWGQPCLVPRQLLSRRGGVRRRRSLPKRSAKSGPSGPPRSWWRIEHRRARAIQRAEMLRDPEDPMVTPDKRPINLWSWY